jgi:hypothetical protein
VGGDRRSQQIARGEDRDAQPGGDGRCLGALSSARSAEQDDDGHDGRWTPSGAAKTRMING